MHFSSSPLAFMALTGFSFAEPNGWSKTKSAPDSPTKLDDCGCWPIYQAILRCQKLKGPNANTDDCVCIPNPKGWYPSMDGCRTCLSPGSLEDDFFDNVSRLITQLFVSCTNTGGGVRSDGSSLCASNYYREACVSLGTNGKRSWASYEVFESKEGGNSSYVLDIAEYGSKNETSTKGASTEATATATKTDTESATDSASTTDVSSIAITASTKTADASSSENASGTETDAAAATKSASSGAAVIGTKSFIRLLETAVVAAIMGLAFL
ncbi:hypothetical protein F53441_5740 [Fusarium austroafricanum]|uniref:Extracellular membrane protein CFEM domain-containing protein n=1 Tax=Fusarium austroafricanum TaxID=2364996 RepID=A0A8H4KLB8_9HYPO|nr:hypothetical protein F53441_5740 [Fusarium austroafricanum]